MLLDLLNAKYCVERAEERFGQIPELGVLKTALSHLEKFEFDLAAKCLKTHHLNLANALINF